MILRQQKAVQTRGRMSARVILLISVLSGGGAWVHAEDLAPEFEMERLLILVEQQLAAQNYADMQESLTAISELGIALPANYYYYQAQLAFEQRSPALARENLVRYVNQAGREGEFYEQALRFISSIDQDLKRQQQAPEPKADIQAATTQPEDSPVGAEERRNFVEQLKSLYLKSNSRDALVEHANALLATHPFIGSRIRDLTRRQGIQYRVSISGGKTILLQRSDYTRSGQADFQTEPLDVFGVNPYLQWDCDYGLRQCWIANPVRRSDKWILLEDDPDGTRELSRTLSYLILELQG